MTELVRTYKLTDSGAWGWVTEEAEGGGGGSLPVGWTQAGDPAVVDMHDGKLKSGPNGDGISVLLDGSGFQSDDGADGFLGVSVADGFFSQPNNDTPAFTADGTGGATVALDGGGLALINLGAVTILGLPTADPTVAGQLWNDTGTVKVSAG